MRRWITGVAALCLGFGAAGPAAARRHHHAARAGATARPNGNGPPQPAKAPGPAPGSAPAVVFVTDKRAYLNRGARDGLEPKQQLQLLRGARAAGTCTIETLADRQATCVGARPRPGDGFRLTARESASRRGPAAPVLPPLTDEETLAERAEAVAQAPYDKVDFTGTPGIAGHTRAQLTPGIVVWHSQPDGGGDYTLEQIDGAIQVYDIAGTGVRFDAAFTAMHWGPRSDAGRFRPNTPSQFYLWEAEFSKRRSVEGAGTVFAVGRIWPWHTPGLTMLDGMQVGRRNETGSAEGGVYAGLVPWALDVAPTTQAWASGLYGALVQTGGSKGLFRLAREEVRVGVARAPETGFLTDAEALVQAWLGAWNVGGGARVLRASVAAPRPVLDRAHLDLGARATTAFGVGLHVRYFSGALPVTPLDGIAPATAYLSAMADAHWDLARWLGVAAFGGTNRDRASGLAESYVAAEVRLPRLFGDGGGASGGVEMDEGWLRGRLAYVQLVGRFGERVQLVGRVTASSSEITDPIPVPNVDELGAYLHLDGALARWLRLRAWSLIRVPVLIQGETPAQPNLGIVGGGSLTGAF